VKRFGTRRKHARLLPLAGSAAALLFGLTMIAFGRFRSFQACGWPEIAALAALWGALLASATRRVRSALGGATPTLWNDVELGALLLATAEAVALLAGGVHSPLYPVVYLVMAFLVAFMRPRAGVLLTVLALLFDLLAFIGLRALPSAWPEYAAHAGFLTLFAVLYQGVLAAQIAASRRAEGAAVARRLRQFEERAREYRLIASGTERSDAGPEAQARWVAAAVREVEQAVGSALEVAECALHTHTCAVFLLSPDDRELRLQDCRSRSDALLREPFNAGEGILGGVVKRRMPLRLCGDFKGVSYYQHETPIRSLLAVPLIDRRSATAGPLMDGASPEPRETTETGFVRGVLLADRLEDRPFEDEDERLLWAVGREVLRAIEIERVMGYIKSARDEKDRFYRAIEELNRAAKPDEVLETALEICRSLAPIDFGAITLCEEEPEDAAVSRFHRIARVSGVHGGQALQGHRFKDNNGLCANVVRYGTPLPGRGVRLGERPLVFGEEAELRGIQALKILPLKSGDRVLGTLVAASRRRGAFEDDVVRMLEVIALQAAQSLQRAQLFAEVERMAVIDGLTGLHNHRHFQNLLDQRLALAQRYGKPLSLLLCDIDHFKTVNDTYGHPVGDAVLRGVARLLSAQARAVDLVARYGGEEFAIVLPETDSSAARALAERIRASVAAAELRTSLGPVKVTLSLGVATFPDVADGKQTLIDRADQALYAAKHAGRNRFVVAEGRTRLAGA
jgi:two-component system, cell cycle response regulator